jgi:two-component system sensor histidine kinase KdpD
MLVRCDLTLTLQILANLLENAARYSPAGSPIDVIVTCAGPAVHITVADRGPGLSADEVMAVFEPLRRGTASRRVTPAPSLETSDREGMGMGLAIARTFARVQQGDVTYRDREGGGGEFTVTLPMATAFAEVDGGR